MPAPIYAIGDIHGQREMLGEALERIAADGGPDAQVVFLGDYVDRGPDCLSFSALLTVRHPLAKLPPRHQRRILSHISDFVA